MQNIWNALDSWLFNGKDARCPRMRLWAKPSVQRLVAPCLQVGRMNRSLIDALPDVRLTTKRQILRRSLVEFPQCYIRRNKFVNCRLEIHQIKLIFLNLSCDFGAVKASHSFSFEFVFIWMRAKGRRRRTYYPNFWAVWKCFGAQVRSRPQSRHQKGADLESSDISSCPAAYRTLGTWNTVTGFIHSDLVHHLHRLQWRLSLLSVEKKNTR